VEVDITSTQILFLIGSLILGGIITFLVQRKLDRAKISEDDFARMKLEVEQLKITSVNEIRVREIIKDAIEPMSSTVKEIKDKMDHFGDVLQDIQLKLATEMAYQRGKNHKE